MNYLKSRFLQAIPIALANLFVVSLVLTYLTSGFAWAQGGQPCATSHTTSCDSPCQRVVEPNFYCCNTYSTYCCQRICNRVWCDYIFEDACEGGPFSDYSAGNQYDQPCHTNGQCEGFDPGG